MWTQVSPGNLGCACNGETTAISSHRPFLNEKRLKSSEEGPQDENLALIWEIEMTLREEEPLECLSSMETLGDNIPWQPYLGSVIFPTQHPVMDATGNLIRLPQPDKITSAGCAAEQRTDLRVQCLHYGASPGTSGQQMGGKVIYVKADFLLNKFPVTS